jgi:hypothetical protein
MPSSSTEPTRSPFARISTLAAGLRVATAVLEVVVVISMLAGVGIGIFVAPRSAAIGALIAFGAVLCGLLCWSVARGLHLLAEHVAVQHRIDLALRRELLVNAAEREYAAGTGVDGDAARLQQCDRRWM